MNTEISSKFQRAEELPRALQGQGVHGCVATGFARLAVVWRRTEVKGMKSQIISWASVAVVCGALVGCDRTISREEKTDVKSDGSVKTSEKTVTEKSDGTIEKKEETKKTTP
jgi:hypothetical protein